MVWDRRAVIDIGTNSVKLLVADVGGQEVRPLLEESKQTRLGQGFYETHRLQSDAIERTARAVGEFVECARSEGAPRILAFATSAARDADNCADFLDRIRAGGEIEVAVISGEQEADWAFQGVTSAPQFATEPLLIVDIGGGSTEFIVGQGREKRFRESFKIGSVRLLERIRPGDPPALSELRQCREWIRDVLEREVSPKLKLAMAKENAAFSSIGSLQFVGTGGTTTILGRMEARLETYDRAKLDAMRLEAGRISYHVKKMWSLSLDERKNIVGLPKSRADVILTGAAIMEGIVQEYGFSEVRVSTRGLRFGAIIALHD
jgi:exopolyphosphatase/guanosine-5'-triphosphate,3'-diphosphate pyrophosphatase